MTLRIDISIKKCMNENLPITIFDEGIIKLLFIINYYYNWIQEIIIICIIHSLMKFETK